MTTVAIVGRPNVGKSTLFNRLVGRKLALVDDTPGVTRDRREGDAQLGDLIFRIVDTAGLDGRPESDLDSRIQEQTAKAIEIADICLFMIDGREGVTHADRDIAEKLRRSRKPVVLAVNKAEGRAARSGVGEAHGLGFGEPVALSAEHGEGLDELYDRLAPHIPERAKESPKRKRRPKDEDEHDDIVEQDGDERPDRPLQLAIVGRPNAGKSTLINRLIGEERLLTSAEAGTTRDSIALDWTYNDRPIQLFDTAGLRRRARVSGKLEKLSVADALRAVRFAEVVVVVLDATMPFDKQDLTIVDLVEREGRACVIALNKWDLVPDKQKKLSELTKDFEELLPQIKGAPFVAMSGLTGNGLDRLMAGVLKAHEIWNKRVSTNELNRWLEGVLERHPPRAIKGRRIRIRYLTQIKTRPPTFAVFGNQLSELQDDYVRYLTNSLRESFDLPGVPIRIVMRTSDNPFAKGER